MEARFETFTVLINRISRNIRRIKNQEMAEYNLKGAHVSCLYYLYKEKGLTATELCERCEEDKATISRALDYLEENSYIIRGPKDVKRYKSPILITEKGLVVGKKISEKIDGVLDEISNSMTEEERVRFYNSLSSISQRLDNVASE